MRSIEADPGDGQTWYLLGRCYMAQQQYRKAYDAYQQAVYRDGRNPTFWCSIGVLYYQINQYRDALDAYSRAIRLNPYLSEVWYDLGTLYESCNQIEDSLDAYQRASELDPGNTHIHQRLAVLRQEQAKVKQQQSGEEAGDTEVKGGHYHLPGIPEQLPNKGKSKTEGATGENNKASNTLAPLRQSAVGRLKTRTTSDRDDQIDDEPSTSNQNGVKEGEDSIVEDNNEQHLKNKNSPQDTEGLPSSPKILKRSESAKKEKKSPKSETQEKLPEDSK